MKEKWMSSYLKLQEHTKKLAELEGRLDISVKRQHRIIQRLNVLDKLSMQERIRLDKLEADPYVATREQLKRDSPPTYELEIGALKHRLEKLETKP